MKNQGGCHCGRVRFEAENLDISKGMICNCSICAKRGSILSFVPETDFKVLQGRDSLTEYLFNTHRVHHLFCKICGILPFAQAETPDGKKMAAINLRCVDGVEADKIPTQMHDGKNH